MHHLRPQAELLRSQGYSYKLIEKRLGIARSTLSYWFKDKPYQPNQEVLERIKMGPAQVGIRRHNARVAEIDTQKRRGFQEIGVLSKRDLWLLGIGIYIGEGAKSTEITRISNSDPAVIRLAVSWFLGCCGMSKDNIAVRLHLYPDNDEKLCLAYWQRITDLPPANFRRSTIDRRTDKQRAKFRRLPYGTAHLTIVSNGDPEKGRKFYRRLDGWMQAALSQV